MTSVLLKKVQFQLIVLILSTLSFTNPAQASELPEGLAFAGLVGEEWRIYLVHEGQLKPVTEISNPRTFSYHRASNLLAFVGADAELSILNLDDSSKTIVLQTNPTSRYTQPSFSRDGRWLLAVELPEGRSRRTNIVGFDSRTGKKHRLVAKRTAQFEPTMGTARYLYYSTASCVDDCGGMIWELWRRDMATGKQVQLSLLNALSNQAHVHGDTLYFSSNADGGQFHIWSMEASVGASPTQLTQGLVRDSDPVTDSTGVLYFLRKTSTEVQVMRREAGASRRLTAIGQFKDLRNLEISW